MAAAEKIKATNIVPIASNAMTPMDMLDRAVAQGANVEILEKLMGLQERWEKNQARKAFDEAVAKAKAEIKPIVRNREGHNQKRYADFAAIAKEVDPILARCGLSYRFRTTQAERINVTCILFGHGHSEESNLSGPADTSGNKNAIQAIGSTLTYLQRYSLVQALGLAVSDDDNGSASGAGETITDEQVIELRDLIEAKAADQPKFLIFFKIEKLSDLPATRRDEALAMLKAKNKVKG